MQTISAQEYRDEEIVAQKLEARDFEVQVSPVFEVDSVQYRVVIDGHHSLEAAKLAGVEPEFVEQSSSDNDTVALLLAGNVEDFLLAHRNDCDYYDVETGEIVW